MFGEENLEVHKKEGVLEITLNWYSYKALFLLFFTILWNAFLLNWYGMAVVGDAPLIFKLFPLIHVGIGLWLIYYTACLFFNRTFIDIADDYLLISHKPIPWWKGNKTIPTKEIEQIYVKQHNKKSKNGTTTTYEIRAKLTDKRDISLLSIGDIASEKFHRIEEELEEFIGITDAPVKGEFGRKTTRISKPEAKRRRQRRDLHRSALGPMYSQEVGDLFHYQQKDWEVTSLTQYDWEDGDSDRAFQLVDPEYREQLLYFIQNKGLLEAYQETMMGLLRTQAFRFDPKQPAPFLQVGEHKYQLDRYKEGLKHQNSSGYGSPVAQWYYYVPDKSRYIRVVNDQKLLVFYEGKRCDIGDFDARLDLDQLPVRERKIDKRWADEDLV
ncbi:MAG: hypothetical protein AAFP19_20665 [Bacteroidota bacterium]